VQLFESMIIPPSPPPLDYNAFWWHGEFLKLDLEPTRPHDLLDIFDDPESGREVPIMGGCYIHLLPDSILRESANWRVSHGVLASRPLTRMKQN
jgi:hypothetical protein